MPPKKKKKGKGGKKKKKDGKRIRTVKIRINLSGVFFFLIFSCQLHEQMNQAPAP